MKSFAASVTSRAILVVTVLQLSSAILAAGVVTFPTSAPQEGRLAEGFAGSDDGGPAFSFRAGGSGHLRLVELHNIDLFYWGSI